MCVTLKTGTIQQLIQFNKKQIRELQTERDYLLYLITEKFWPNALPNNSGYVSQRSYEMLNKTKDDLRGIQKSIKLLAEVQRALKAAIR
jgi:hypothetical protein